MNEKNAVSRTLAVAVGLLMVSIVMPAADAVPADKATCEQDHDGDFLRDGVWDVTNSECLYLTVEAALANADATYPVVEIPASKSVNPTTRDESVSVHVPDVTICGVANDAEVAPGVTPISAERDPPLIRLATNPDNCADDDLVRAATILDGSASSTTLTINADGVTVRGLTIQWAGSADGTAVIVNGNDATLEDVRVRVNGGGCRVDELVMDACFADGITVGVSLQGNGATITDSVIAGDVISTEDQGIGGRDGVHLFGVGNSIEDSTISGWAGNGIIALGDGHELADNTFSDSATGLLICNTAEDLDAHHNSFANNLQAVALAHCASAASGPAPSNMRLRYNFFDLSNAVALQVRNIDNAQVDARLNDWAVYEQQLLDSRVGDEDGSNTILQKPFLGYGHAVDRITT